MLLRVLRDLSSPRILHVAGTCTLPPQSPQSRFSPDQRSACSLPRFLTRFGYALMLGAAVSAALAWRTERSGWLIAFVMLGFAAGGALLASDAWQRAHGSTLRRAFDDIARAERSDAEANGRVLPVDPSAFTLVEGTLRTDASPAPSGVSLNLAVNRIQPLAVAGRPRDVGGGLLVTVGGGLAAARAGEWRAGRRVRLPAELHRAARYLDDGVPDGERALELRGIALVGSAKSGALVEILSRGNWIDEAMAAAPRGREARHRRRRRPMEPAIGRDRLGHRHRRSRRAGRGSAAATAGGRHVPRAGHFWRQHRDSCRPDAGGVQARRHARPDGDDRVGRRAHRLRILRRRRRVGRPRDAHGGVVFRGARGRSPQSAAQRARVRGGLPHRRPAVLGRSIPPSSSPLAPHSPFSRSFPLSPGFESRGS